MLLITNAKVLDPSLGAHFEADVLIDNGRIARLDRRGLKPSVAPPRSRAINAHGSYLAPSFTDLHVHARDLKESYKETIETAAVAAARGGNGGFLAMPNTKPPLDHPKILEALSRKADKLDNLVKIEFVGAVTKKRKGQELTDFEKLKNAGAVAFSDDGSPVTNREIFKNALLKASALGSFVIEHCEDARFPQDSREAEIRGVASALDVLKKTNGCRLHLAHISTKEAIELIRKAKSEGLKERLTCEVCPHHFSLTEEAIKNLGALTKVNPPLRTQADIEALVEAINDGTIDAIASDHAPHAASEKNKGMRRAPCGVIGMETTLAVAITYLVRPKKVSLMRVVELLTVGPAAVLKRPPGRIEPGHPANLVLFDPESAVVFKKFASKSQNSPFLGKKLYGKVLATIYKGRLVYRADRG